MVDMDVHLGIPSALAKHCSEKPKRGGEMENGWMNFLKCLAHKSHVLRFYYCYVCVTLLSEVELT